MSSQQTTNGLRTPAEIWPIKPHFYKNKISLKIATCSYEWKKSKLQSM